MKYLISGLFVLSMLAVDVSVAVTPKDTLVIADRIDDLMTLDPAAMFELTALEYAYNTYTTLIGYDAGKPEKYYGMVAKEWNISSDGLTYTFNIKPNLKFASGNPITADDVAFSLQRAVLLEKSPSNLLTQFGFNQTNVVSAITAISKDTVQINLPAAYAANMVLNCLTTPVASIVDKNLLLSHQHDNDLGNKWLTTNYAGGGPFKLVKWTANQMLYLERNSFYPKTNPINKVIVRHVSEPATQKLLLSKNDVDVARNLQASHLEKLAANLHVVTAPTGHLICLYLNQNNQYLKHKQVRQAIKYLIDYQGIKNNLLKQEVEVQQSFIPNGFFAANTSNPFSFDIAKARQLLQQAGLSDGFSITLDAKNTILAQVLQASFANAGIKVSIIPGDSNQVLTKFRARNYDAILTTWGTDYHDPHANAISFTYNPDNSADSKDKTLAWRTSWNIPGLTKLTLAAAHELDVSKRQALYQTIQKQFFASSPIVVLFRGVDIAVVNQKVLDLKIGVNPNTNAFQYTPML